MAEQTKKVTIKRKRRIPSVDFTDCDTVSSEDTLKFILGIETKDWKLDGTKIGLCEDVKVTHFLLSYCGEIPVCPVCGQKMTLHDHKNRVWRHANLDNTVCYLHADIPRFVCDHCKKIGQVKVPWADPNVSYSKRFCEVALRNMANMSLAATARIMMCSWSLLDGIVEHIFRDYLGTLDLSKVRRIRIDETSAKKRHRYITIITDADTDQIIFITKGKDYQTMKEFSDWLIEHNGNPDNIEIVASDFSDSFIKGTALYFPKAQNVYDPFHVIQLVNKKMDMDRAMNQVNGERKKIVRYALLKNPKKLSDKERELIFDIKRDNKMVGTSYEMNMSLRQAMSLDDPEMAASHLEQWVDWVDEKGSNNFKTAAKTIRKHLDGIVRAISTGINNGFQEGLNAKVQFCKRLANGYHREMRLARIVLFRQAVNNRYGKDEIWY